jgi:hypothetical protein
VQKETPEDTDNKKHKVQGKISLKDKLLNIKTKLAEWTFIYSFFLSFFLLSFRSPSYDRTKASSKDISSDCVIQCFLFQFPVSSRFLKVIQ